MSTMIERRQTRVGTMSENTPIVVIVHEAWHSPTHYARLVDLLSAEGFAVACPQLPTSQSGTNYLASFSDDCSVIYQLVFDLVSDGREVLCLAHGYGSFVASEALTGLNKATRSDSSLLGGVIAMVVIAGFLPNEGDSLKKCFGGEWPEYLLQLVSSTSLKYIQEISNNALG
jgi:dienelactone hydrolase